MIGRTPCSTCSHREFDFFPFNEVKCDTLIWVVEDGMVSGVCALGHPESFFEIKVQQVNQMNCKEMSVETVKTPMTICVESTRKDTRQLFKASCSWRVDARRRQLMWVQVTLQGNGLLIGTSAYGPLIANVGCRIVMSDLEHWASLDESRTEYSHVSLIKCQPQLVRRDSTKQQSNNPTSWPTPATPTRRKLCRSKSLVFVFQRIDWHYDCMDSQLCPRL